MNELTTASVTEGWRIRIDRPGQRDIRYYDSTTYPTADAATAVIRQAVQAGRFDRSRLGIQWQRVEVTKGAVDWVHN